MQYVRARLIWSSEPALAVPVLAVNRLAGQHFVFVAEPAEQGFVARQKPVTLGEVVGEDYVVQRRPASRASASSCRTFRRSATARR